MRDEAKRGDGNAKGTACTPKPWHRCVILSEIHERREMDVVEGSIHGTEYLFMNRFFNFAPIWGFVQNDSQKKPQISSLRSSSYARQTQITCLRSSSYARQAQIIPDPEGVKQQ